MKIALCGKMRAGKDTVADMLVKDYDFYQFKFSQGINEVIEKLFPEDVRSGKKLRRHQQIIGQSMRELDSDVWVKYTMRTVHEFEGCNIVISDLRQSNEADALRREGFVIVKVEADTDVRIARIIESGDIFSPSQLNHETELSVDSIEADFVLTNNHGVDYLRLELTELIKLIKHNL